ncbi:putative hydrolase [Caldovatus sediminis]|uniref:Putative hydrolase n=1 Tax=Caldovatus sediminis TaxID=2041189 RepID=A0A8J3EAC3_9PROT|nr:carbon-nitrogen hydrolase family protein [Caldovatus sediminis]GGG25134.1 putative hydrolase [Caldovatus sediminis]
MPRTLRVGAAQTGPVLSDDPAPGIEAARRLFAQAEREGVRLLCFSELFLAPFFPNRLEKDFDRWFLDAEGPEIGELAALARRHGLAAILPFAERTRGGGYYNSALVVDAEGRRLGTYRKTHIPAYFPTDAPGGTGSFEKLYFAPGDSLPVFETEGLRFGIQICNDRLYPEPSRALALAGAAAIFMPICYSTYADPEHRASIWEVPLRARAYENGVWVVAANRVGMEGPRRHLGRSMVVDPRGGIVAEAGREREELLVADLDLGAVPRARKDFPWWRDRRPDLYGPLVAVRRD